MKSAKPYSRTNENLIRKDPSAVDILDPGDGVRKTSEGTFCIGIDDHNNHEVPTQTPERTTENSLEQVTDTSGGTPIPRPYH